MKNSGINWTHHTANFRHGCFKVSEGCKNCYAESLSKRDVNRALIRLAMKKNASALSPLSVSDLIEKMIAHWWTNEFPDEDVPFDVKRYDADFVQSA